MLPKDPPTSLMESSTEMRLLLVLMLLPSRLSRLCYGREANL